MADLAEVKMRVTGGGDISRVLLDIAKNTDAIRTSLQRQKKAVDEVAQAAKEAARTEAQATKEQERNAAAWEKVAKAAAKEKEKAEKDAAKEVTKTLKDQKEAARAAEKAVKDAAKEKAKAEIEAEKAARKMAQALKEQERAADKTAKAVVGIAKNAASAVAELAKFSGMPGFDKMKSDADDLEEMLKRLRVSMGMSKEDFAKLNAGETIKQVSLASGKSPLEVVKGITDIQNETSRGPELLANNGALLKSQARFAQVTDSKVGETGITLSKFAEQYGIGAEDQAKLPGMLIQQQLQGSLEAGTASKFVKLASSHKMLTGKSGLGGFSELLALGNVVKDKAGLQGEQGAATAATWLGAMLGDLSKGKSVTGVDNSPANLLKSLAGINIRDDKGHIDVISMVEKLAQYRAKVGDKKYTETLGMAFRNVGARRAVSMLVASAEQDKPGTDKNLHALANPNAAKGEGIIQDAITDLGGTAKASAQDAETKETFNMLENKEQVDTAQAASRDAIGGFLSKHPTLNALANSTTIQALAGWVGYKGLKSGLKSQILRSTLQASGTTAAAVGGLAQVATMSGDTAKPRDVELDDQINDLQGRIKTREKNGSGNRGSFGDFTGWNTTEDLKAKLADLKQERDKIVVPAPQVNVTVNVNAMGVEARVISEQAHPTNALARGTGGRPQTTPGKQ